MKLKKKKKKKIIALSVTILIVFAMFGITFSLWTYSKKIKNQLLIAGELYMRYTHSNSVFINNTLPTSEYNPENLFEFTIEGKNTYSKPIWYEIILEYGETPADRKTRIPDKFLRFRLTEQIEGGQEEVVIEEGTYTKISKGQSIWVNTINPNAKTESKITYKLYVWISDEIKIGDVDQGADIDKDTWDNDAFASIAVTVKGDFKRKDLDENLPESAAVRVIKSTLGQANGIIGVSVDDKGNVSKVTDTSSNTIREYRYSGLDVNNYVYFNCKDGATQTTSNCELWRIIGVFQDGGYNKIKIVRDKALDNNLFPETYDFGDITYKIKLPTAGKIGAYWNDVSESNDWATAGIQYWLNSQGTGDKGYLKSLSYNAQNMISDTKYYLGNVKYSSAYIDDTSISAYANERAVTGCANNKGPATNNSRTNVENNKNCLVYANNAATWIGKIALMYPSDYGFSADSQYWNTNLGTGGFDGDASASSWIFKGANLTSSEWLLNGNTGGANFISYLRNQGRITTQGSENTPLYIRPTLYLKSDILIDGGTGTKADPYKLKYDNIFVDLSEENGSVLVDGETTFTATTNIKGTFNVTSTNSQKVNITTQGSNTNQVTVTIKGKELGDADIKVEFIPTDPNYKRQTKTYKVVVADKVLATTEIKSQLGKGGLVSITQSSAVSASDKNVIREYRYSGLNVNNYVYFNCKDNQPQSSTNCEKWRILGVFKDEKGEDHIKIVRNEVLSSIPTTYEANEKTFNLGSSSNSKYSRWDTDVDFTNNWAEAGLMNWLNSKGTVNGYLKNLSITSQNMIKKTKYYLGTTYPITDKVKTSYEKETAITDCVNNIGPETNTSKTNIEKNANCQVWANNAATWEGEIALMYPSDYGFSVDSQYWASTELFKYNTEAAATSWLSKANHVTSSEWLLSPSVLSTSSRVDFWALAGQVSSSESSTYNYFVRPALYLNSDINITGGSGTDASPYQLSM